MTASGNFAQGNPQHKLLQLLAHGENNKNILKAIYLFNVLFERKNLLNEVRLLGALYSKWSPTELVATGAGSDCVIAAAGADGISRTGDGMWALDTRSTAARKCVIHF